MKAIGAATGQRPMGWLSPRCTPSSRTSALLAKAGFDWHADFFDSDLPYRHKTAAGSIAALFGLTHHLIDKTQYTELLTVVILSAFVPTLIAQQLFQPAIVDTQKEESLGEEDLSIIHHRPDDPPDSGRC